MAYHHTECGCGSPSVIAESPVEYYDGLSLDSDDRAADLRSVPALITVLRQAATRTALIQLYPIGDGDKSTAPKGVLEWKVGALDAERLFFNEGFMHIVQCGNAPPAGSP